MAEPRGRYSRGYLPHIDAGHRLQFVTWRLRDSLPKGSLEQLRADLERLPASDQNREWRKRVEECLDQGHGELLLKKPLAARATQQALIFGHPERYELKSWTIMPNHIHAVLSPAEGWTLSNILQSLKGYTSHEINRLLKRSGPVWQRESFDSAVRDGRHLETTIGYIEWNPVKAGLCQDPKLWPYASANPDVWHFLELNS